VGSAANSGTGYLLKTVFLLHPTKKEKKTNEKFFNTVMENTRSASFHPLESMNCLAEYKEPITGFLVKERV
jgi:hypothetical protein